MNWKGDSNAGCDKTRQISFFFLNEKEGKLCKKKMRRGEKGEEGRKRGGGGRRGGRGKVFDFFQRYYKLSECSCSYCINVNAYFILW